MVANLNLSQRPVLDSETLARVNNPTATATGLPNEAYTARGFFEAERENLFAKTWTCVGHGCAIASPGDARPVGFLGVPLVMVRNNSNEIQVFHNVCSHRGNELVWKACNFKGVIRCPYHAWTYDFDGNLRGTPHIGGPGNHELDSFERERHGLRPVPTAVWMDLVFVNLSGDAPPFETHIAELEQRLYTYGSAEDFSRLKPAHNHGTLELQLDANWKLCMENYLESYHLPWIHPDLNSYSRLEDHYHFYGGDLFAGQGTNVYDFSRGSNTTFPLFEGWPDKIAEYPALFPNVFVGIHCDHFWTIIVEPVAHDRTVERLQIYYLGEGADGEDYETSRDANFTAWDKVFHEDVGVVEGMQRGRCSPAFGGGAFSAVMDKPTHYFAKWVANRLSAD